MVDDSKEKNPSPVPDRSDEPLPEFQWTLGSLWNTAWDLGSLTAKLSDGGKVIEPPEHNTSKAPHAEDHTRAPQDPDLEASCDDFSIDWNLSPDDYPKEPSSGLPRSSTLPDLGKLRYHRHLADFGQQLQKAAEATMVTDRKSNYVKVTVLLLYWEDEDSGIVLKVDKLGHVLSQHYGFIVERWAIPVNNRCHMEVSRRVGELVEDDNPVHLRVMFYTGSSHLTPKGQLVWMPRQDVSRQSRPPIVRWSAIQTLLEEAPVDILILLDCRKSHFPGFEGGNGVTSLIAACSFNTIARQESEFSFIEVLIRQLDSLRNVPSFSTSFLYSRIYQDIQSRPDQKESSSSELPVHLILSQDPAYPRDILLSATQDQSRLRRSYEQGRSKQSEKCPSRCNSPSRKGPWHVSAERSNKSIKPPLPDLSDHPRLLLSFRLYEDMDPEALRVDLFSHWLMSLPIPFDAVKVEAGFASDSTIILISVPLCFLPFLPSDPSLNVIGTVHSQNLMSAHSPDADQLGTTTTDPGRLAGNPAYNSYPEHPVSKTVFEGYLRQDEALNGCEFSPDGNLLACWSNNTLTLIDFSQPGGSGEFMCQCLPPGPSWKAVVFAESLLIAATDEMPLTCYLCNLGTVVFDDLRLHVWERVQYPLPAFRSFAISPGQRFLTFLLGKTESEEIACSKGVNLFQISIKKFVKNRQDGMRDISQYRRLQKKIMFLVTPEENELHLRLSGTCSGYIVAQSTGEVIPFSPSGIKAALDFGRMNVSPSMDAPKPVQRVDREFKRDLIAQIDSSHCLVALAGTIPESGVMEDFEESSSESGTSDSSEELELEDIGWEWGMEQSPMSRLSIDDLPDQLCHARRYSWRRADNDTGLIPGHSSNTQRRNQSRQAQNLTGTNTRSLDENFWRMFDDARRTMNPTARRTSSSASEKPEETFLIYCGNQKFIKTGSFDSSKATISCFGPPKQYRVLKLLIYHKGETLALATKRHRHGQTTHLIGISTESEGQDVLERDLAELEGLLNFIPGTDQAVARVTVDNGQSCAVIGVVVDNQWYAVYRVAIPELDNATNEHQTGESSSSKD